MSIFEFSAEMDPVAFTVNKRYRDNQSVHPDVARAMDDLGTIIKAKSNREGFELSPTSALKLSLVLTFRTNRGDLSNPIKRVEDTLARVLGFNDARIQELHVYRKAGGMNIYGKLEEFEAEWTDDIKPPAQEARWIL